MRHGPCAPRPPRREQPRERPARVPAGRPAGPHRRHAAASQRRAPRRHGAGRVIEAPRDL
eukprot:7799495-Alexandrium_andersonii.AAC.1